jgi:hypothetical protein
LEELLVVLNEGGFETFEKCFKARAARLQDKIPGLGIEVFYFDKFNNRAVLRGFRDHALQTDKALKACACMAERGENLEYLGAFNDGVSKENFELIYKKGRQEFGKLVGGMPSHMPKKAALLNRHGFLFHAPGPQEDLGILEARVRHALLHFFSKDPRFAKNITWMTSYVQTARVHDPGRDLRICQDAQDALRKLTHLQNGVRMSPELEEA